jgi:hypothetical protein
MRALQGAYQHADPSELIRDGVPCGVCGGTLTLCGEQRQTRGGAGHGGVGGGAGLSAERRLLEVLREADGRPVGALSLAEAGIADLASAIFELERAGYRIQRAYAGGASEQRRFLGYHL